MIFSSCKNNHTIICYYEAGQEPIGVFEEIVCEECQVKTYVERISFDGRSFDEEEFFKLGVTKVDA